MNVKLDERQVVPCCKCIAAATLVVSSNSSMQVLWLVSAQDPVSPVGEGITVTCNRRSVSMIVTIKVT